LGCADCEPLELLAYIRRSSVVYDFVFSVGRKWMGWKAVFLMGWEWSELECAFWLLDYQGIWEEMGKFSLGGIRRIFCVFCVCSRKLIFVAVPT